MRGCFADAPERWRIEDSLYVMKIMSYLGLADVQMDIEKLIMEAMQMVGRTRVVRVYACVGVC